MSTTDPVRAGWAAGLRESEQAVVGAAMADTAAAQAAATAGLVHTDFEDPVHRAIWAAIAEGLATSGGTDSVDVFTRLQKAGQVDDCGGLKHLHELSSGGAACIIAGQPQRVLHHVKRIQQAAHARRLLGLAEDFASGRATANGVAHAQAALLALQATAPDAGGFVLPLRDGPAEPRQEHPLTAFIDLDCEPRPPKFIVPGFVLDGVLVLAGAHGAGKTTVFVPLALVVAGLHAAGDELAPKHWRHVVYIAEDAAQVQRIVAGLVRHAGLCIDPAAVVERFHVVPAQRMPAEQVAAAGPIYRERFTREVDGVELPPLVVIDTRSATIDVADENDNAEAGRIVALFKQRFAGLPLWMVGHLAKALTSRRDVPSLSMRGAGAIEADAHQTMFLVVEDDGRRFLVLGKKRFEPRWNELEVISGTATTMALDEWGDPVSLTLRWGLPRPPVMTRDEARHEADQRAMAESHNALRSAILDAVEAAWKAGMPINREGVKGKCRGRSEDVVRTIAALESDCWLVEVVVPRDLRTHPKRSGFLVRLADDERRDYLAGQGLPEAKGAIPAAWRRANSSIPELGTDAPPQGACGAPDTDHDFIRSRSSVPLKDGMDGTDGRGLEVPPVQSFRSGDLGTVGNGWEWMKGEAGNAADREVF